MGCSRYNAELTYNVRNNKNARIKRLLADFDGGDTPKFTTKVLTCRMGRSDCLIEALKRMGTPRAYNLVEHIAWVDAISQTSSYLKGENEDEEPAVNRTSPSVGDGPWVPFSTTVLENSCLIEGYFNTVSKKVWWSVRSITEYLLGPNANEPAITYYFKDIAWHADTLNQGHNIIVSLLEDAEQCEYLLLDGVISIPHEGVPTLVDVIDSAAPFVDPERGNTLSGALEVCKAYFTGEEMWAETDESEGDSEAEKDLIRESSADFLQDMYSYVSDLARRVDRLEQSVYGLRCTRTKGKVYDH
jgi:hypothetical protein